jgi:PAS domain S-box-containing protein
VTRVPSEHILDLLTAIEPVLDDVRACVTLISPSGIILYANEPAIHVTGLSCRESVDAEAEKIFGSSWQDIQAVFDTGKPRDFDYGERTGPRVKARLQPIFLSGTIEAVALIIQDPFASRSTVNEEDSRWQMTRLLDAVMKSSYDGLWITDNKGVIIRINRAAERITGCTAAGVVGRTFRDLAEEGLIGDSAVCEVLERRTTVTLVHSTNQGKKVLSTASPIFDSNDEIDLVVVNDRDITELNRMSEDLDRSKALVDIYQQELTDMQLQDVDMGYYICKSKTMQTVHEKVLRVSQYDSTVLLTGESGVGKGKLARLIHEKSSRSDGPFIRVDCGAIVETLFESELFGYEKGAFTGAIREGKPGLVEMAGGGTLFFDEIGEVPLSQQVKLLRFLDDKCVVRVGGSAVCQVDTRVIAATNKDLAEGVETGRFRRDLFYRLNVVSLVIPPIRGRRDDIRDLIHFFVRKIGKKLNVYKQIDEDALLALEAHGFPGNVRELEHMVESLLIMSQGDRIVLDDLPPEVRDASIEDVVLSRKEATPLPNLISQVETQQILEAVEKYGSQREAARHLGINQSTISRKLRKTR